MKTSISIMIVISIGILTSVTLLYFPFPARLSIEGLQDSYKANELIAFTLFANGCGSSCDQIEIIVILKETNQVLYETVMVVDGLTQFPLFTNTREYVPANGIIRINEPGNYTMIIDYNGSIIEKKISII